MTTPELTPGKNPFAISAPALAAAIAAEWEGQGKFVAANMPLTQLAFTAIDRIAPQKENVVEALLIFLDTDTLSYRSDDQAALLLRQQEHWDPVLDWAAKKFGHRVEVTSGVMPIDQSPELHKALGAYLNGLDAMHLAGLSILASVFSSIILAVSVVDRHLDAMRAFRLSRLEEDTQAEQWGVDEEAEKRAARLEEETRSVSSFFNLLDEAKIHH
ncbi:MAG: ATPase [Alphaproteobacteria bacterium]|nr:ATPase [Alphaproteobacteria bacterium]